jgi:tRNA-dihydrouridine synthase B
MVDIVKSFSSRPQIILAPMDGITDQFFRQTVDELYGGYDFMATEFLRVSPVTPLTSNQILSQLGHWVVTSPEQLKRTILQLMAAPNSLLADSLKIVDQLGVEWLDLNAGCPSKKVNAHLGGAHLLRDLDALKRVVAMIRANYSRFFSVKIRLGYEDSSNFKQVLEILEGEGVDAVAIHCRTRAKLYSGAANWDYLSLAVEQCNLPIIASGDIFSSQAITEVIATTGCHGVMCARGAVRSPWIAKSYRSGDQPLSISQHAERSVKLLESIDQKMEHAGIVAAKRLRRLKGLLSYLWDQPELHGMRMTLLRSQSIDQLWEVVRSSEL